MGKKFVDPNKLCMGCMKELDDPSKPCPHCGFWLPKYQKPANSLPPMEILNGKYLVGKVIGLGGFGITYIGWNLFMCTRVCIKEYFPKGVAFRPENQTRTHTYAQTQYSVDVYTEQRDKSVTAYMGGLRTYIKEAENLAKFYTMPGIVSVRDFFYGNRTAYIVMEYLDGITLKQYAKYCGGRLKPELLFPMLKDVFYAMNTVHKSGIIHRDISPDNIMINREMKAKVIDFGAAREYQENKDTSILLKHGYAPVEQYDRNGQLGPWTDIYSLSATIYYLLSGIKIQRSIDRQKGDQVQLLQVVGVPVSEEQDMAVKKALSIRKEDRYQTMAEFYQDLYGETMMGEPEKTPMAPVTPAADMKKTTPKPTGNVIDVAQKYIVEHGAKEDGSNGNNQ